MTDTLKADSGAALPAPFVGDNLLLLMGLPAGCRVLAIGDNLDSWKGLFRNCSVSADVPEQSSGTEPYGLILYHFAVAATSNSFGVDMKRSRSLLVENGSILVFAENPTSLGNLRKLKQGEFGTFFGRSLRGYVAYEQELRRIGFGDVRCYYALPGLEQTEELVEVGSRMLEIPHYRHPLLHAASKFGLFRLLAEGFVFHAGMLGVESGDLINRINDELSRQSGRHVVRCALKRLDIRSRGALVLFLEDEESGKRFVARIISDKKIIEIVQKNHEFLCFLHNLYGLPETLKKQLPLTLLRMEYSGSSVYVESMVEGSPAWKVNGGKLKVAIFQEAIGFLIQLNLATAQLKRLDDSDLDELLRDDLSRIVNSAVIASSFQEKMVRLISGIRGHLKGRELYLTASHGDYGYGNILVDPGSGALKGVIDWDTARQRDFPDVDLLNLCIQKERAERVCGPLEAFSRVFNDYTSGGINAGLALWTQGTWDSVGNRNLAVYLCFIRYTTRSLQYPRIFLDEQDDYCSILEQLQEGRPL